MRDAREQARHFLQYETEFHLGALVTEQPHSKTVGLAETLQSDLNSGIRMLQAADADVTVAAERVLASEAYSKLVDALCSTLRNGGRICFSGCGATGRLSILIEACWRHFWTRVQTQHPEAADSSAYMSERVCSIMTGGDYALIRSVENFEDYMTFGRRQVQEAGLGRGDVLVAISEGGETSSVIGTVWEAFERGATVFFAFNNPAAALAACVERSRLVIEEPRITTLDLATGPMAVAGSTRMQATTIELLAVGSALEQAMCRALQHTPAAMDPELGEAGTRQPEHYRDLFAELLADLGAPGVVDAIAQWVLFEEGIYRSAGLVTYMADECLLDIFTDTTERAPTFMLPPFRKCDDTVSPPSWAFVKNPLLGTPEAWQRVLGRDPRCLDWDASMYRNLGGPERLQTDPPRLDAAEIMKFRVGNEEDTSRRGPASSAAVLVALGAEGARLCDSADPLRAAFQAAAASYRRHAAVSLGTEPVPANIAGTQLHVPCRLHASPLRLWDRLAVKLVLNTVSTATMGRMGRLVSNWMAHVETTNKKLVDRGTRLIAELAGVEYDAACYALHETLAELKARPEPGQERPSPVALTIARIKQAHTAV